jgi:outer membrane protein assembly factor BamB
VSRCALFALAFSALSSPAQAGNWPQWRGPFFNGSSSEKGLPSTWSKTSAAWAADLPGPAAATPIIWDDLVFVSTVDSAASSLNALCLDRHTGKVLWNKTVWEGNIRLDDRSNYATPSPVADAQRCFFTYGNGLLLAFDHAGKPLWSRNLFQEYGELAMNWTYSCSPTLYQGKLYLEVLQQDSPARGHGKPNAPHDSFLLVLDPATGTNIARVVRPTDAVSESHDAYTTPIPLEDQGGAVIMISGGDYITGHDLATGRELWRSVNYNPRKAGNWRMVPSPVVSGGFILVCCPQTGNPVGALKREAGGGQPKFDFAWRDDNDRNLLTVDVPTPAVWDGDFFVLADQKNNLSRVEAATGKIKWTIPTPGGRKYEMPPTAADGKIYLMNHAGDVTVVNAADGTILGTIPMGDGNDEQVRSCIPVSQGALYIRTNRKLYCIGKS